MGSPYFIAKKYFERRNVKVLNKPKFMTPSTNMQECVIDVKADKIPFSCIVDGNEAIYAWRIRIYKLDNNEMVLDTDKVGRPPFFPIDEKNRNVVFNIDLKQYIGEGSSFTNQIEPYYWTIEFWNYTDNEKDKIQISTGVEDYIPTTKSCEEVFYANSTPKPEIKYSIKGSSFESMVDGVNFNAKECTFKAIYTQEDGVPLKRYGWRLTDTDGNHILLDTISHNQIYGTKDNIVCSYSGLLNDGKYSIELYIETQNGKTVFVDPIKFTVSYATTFLDHDFKVEVLKSEPGIITDWSDAKIIAGENHGKINFKENYPLVVSDLADAYEGMRSMSVEIPKGSYITYEYGANSNLDITEDSYIVLSTLIHEDEDATLFMAEGVSNDGLEISRSLGYSASMKSINYAITSSNVYPDGMRIAVFRGVSLPNTYIKRCVPNGYVWYTIIMSPFLGEDGEDTFLHVIPSRALNGLYPASDLYPGGKLFPTFGRWESVDYKPGEDVSDGV